MARLGPFLIIIVSSFVLFCLVSFSTRLPNRRFPPFRNTHKRRSTMEEFLKNAKQAAGSPEQYSKFHVVIGNEACDLDSTVSALAYAFFLHKTAAIDDTSVAHVPVLNIPRADLPLRTETTFFLAQQEIPADSLTFRDDINLTSLHANDKLSLTLVDHNVIRAREDQDLESAVVEVIDHHKDERPESDACDKTVETVGSCTTLVAEKILEKDATVMDKQLAALLMGTILVDTVNRSAEAQKVTPKDEDILERLKDFCPEVDEGKLFQSIQDAKFDISELSVPDLLRKDLKSISNNDVTIAMASITMDLEELLDKPNLIESMKEFCSRQNAKVLVVMTIATNKTGGMERQLAVYSEDNILRERVSVSLQVAETLDTATHVTLGLSHFETGIPTLRAYHQGNVAASRKKVLPILQDFLETPFQEPSKPHLTGSRGLFSPESSDTGFDKTPDSDSSEHEAWSPMKHSDSGLLSDDLLDKEQGKPDSVANVDVELFGGSSVEASSTGMQLEVQNDNLLMFSPDPSPMLELPNSSSQISGNLLGISDEASPNTSCPRTPPNSFIDSTLNNQNFDQMKFTTEEFMERMKRKSESEEFADFDPIASKEVDITEKDIDLMQLPTEATGNVVAYLFAQEMVSKVGKDLEPLHLGESTDSQQGTDASSLEILRDDSDLNESKDRANPFMDKTPVVETMPDPFGSGDPFGLGLDPFSSGGAFGESSPIDSSNPFGDNFTPSPVKLQPDVLGNGLVDTLVETQEQPKAEETTKSDSQENPFTDPDFWSSGTKENTAADLLGDDPFGLKEIPPDDFDKQSSSSGNSINNPFMDDFSNIEQDLDATHAKKEQGSASPNPFLEDLEVIPEENKAEEKIESDPSDLLEGDVISTSTAESSRNDLTNQQQEVKEAKDESANQSTGALLDVFGSFPPSIEDPAGSSPFFDTEEVLDEALQTESTPKAEDKREAWTPLYSIESLDAESEQSTITETSPDSITSPVSSRLLDVMSPTSSEYKSATESLGAITGSITQSKTEVTESWQSGITSPVASRLLDVTSPTLSDYKSATESLGAMTQSSITQSESEVTESWQSGITSPVASRLLDVTSPTLSDYKSATESLGAMTQSSITQSESDQFFSATSPSEENVSALESPPPEVNELEDLEHIEDMQKKDDSSDDMSSSPGKMSDATDSSESSNSYSLESSEPANTEFMFSKAPTEVIKEEDEEEEEEDDEQKTPVAPSQGLDLLGQDLATTEKFNPFLAKTPIEMPKENPFGPSSLKEVEESSQYPALDIFSFDPMHTVDYRQEEETSKFTSSEVVTGDSFVPGEPEEDQKAYSFGDVNTEQFAEELSSQIVGSGLSESIQEVKTVEKQPSLEEESTERFAENLTSDVLRKAVMASLKTAESIEQAIETQDTHESFVEDTLELPSPITEEHSDNDNQAAEEFAEMLTSQVMKDATNKDQAATAVAERLTKIAFEQAAREGLELDQFAEDVTSAVLQQAVTMDRDESADDQDLTPQSQDHTMQSFAAVGESLAAVQTAMKATLQTAESIDVAISKTEAKEAFARGFSQLKESEEDLSSPLSDGYPAMDSSTTDDTSTTYSISSTPQLTSPETPVKTFPELSGPWQESDKVELVGTREEPDGTSEDFNAETPLPSDQLPTSGETVEDLFGSKQPETTVVIEGTVMKDVEEMQGAVGGVGILEVPTVSVQKASPIHTPTDHDLAFIPRELRESGAETGEAEQMPGEPLTSSSPKTSVMSHPLAGSAPPTPEHTAQPESSPRRERSSHVMEGVAVQEEWQDDELPGQLPEDDLEDHGTESGVSSPSTTLSPDRERVPPSSLDLGSGARPKQRKRVPLSPNLNVNLDSTMTTQDSVDETPDDLDDDDLDNLPDDIDTPDDMDDFDSSGHGNDLEWEDDTPIGSSRTTPQGESVPQFAADEEARMWRTVVIGEQEHRIDMKVIDPYKKVISHGGYYGEGLNAIIVFAACYMPDSNRPDYKYVMDNLFLYIISTLELLVAEDYMIVYLHGGTPRQNVPSIGWLKKCYQMIDRRLRKNLKQLLIVHPSFWLKTIIRFTRPFISSKFYRKVVFVYSLNDLASKIPMEYIYIPEHIREYDKDFQMKRSMSFIAGPTTSPLGSPTTQMQLNRPGAKRQDSSTSKESRTSSTLSPKSETIPGSPPEKTGKVV
ncbi:protein prune homolog 2-like isoform X3 [Branchiostoma lanceolatum]|uniref:protein prune homolog 2-like isoform X3 n=1 Tax=Branchiostoma lanceolatum TaxID=7740 RepID=UPI0034560F26